MRAAAPPQTAVPASPPMPSRPPSVTKGRPPAVGGGPKATATKPGCDPAFTYDEDGNKIFKPDLRRAAAHVAVQAVMSELFPDDLPSHATVSCDQAGCLSVTLEPAGSGPADPGGLIEQALGLLNLPLAQTEDVI